MEERPDEIFARQSVEKAVGVPLRHHDDNSAPALYDYDIVWPDRSPSALEIVSWRDPRQTRNRAGWRKHTSDEYLTKALRMSWLLGTQRTSAVEFASLVEKAERLLSSLEREDIHEAPIRGWSPLSQEPGADIAGALIKLGIFYAKAHESMASSGGISVELTHGTGSPVSTEPVVDAIVACLAEHQDVVVKLSKSGRDDCQVFIVLDDTRYEAIRAWEYWPDEPLPQRVPQLPDPIKRVWVAPMRAHSVWTTDRFGPWKVHPELGSGPNPGA